MTELKDLIGEHILTGVDFDAEQVWEEWGDEYQTCQVMRFCLDGKVYSAIEDPQDGYRSCMRDLIVNDAAMSNTFEPVGVIGVHRTDGGLSEIDNVLELIDITTGGLVIEVGTTNTDDYYPCYLAVFRPENMKLNVKANKHTHAQTDALIAGITHYFVTNDQSMLRNMPEGRAFLLDIALKHRKIPLAIRMFPKLTGQAARRTLEQDMLT